MLKQLYFLPITIILLGLLIGATIDSNKDFEGKILYQRAALNDTSNIELYIKAANVRINYYDNSGVLNKYKLIDFKEKNYYTVNPRKKLYVQSSFSDEKNIPDNDAEIKKTKNCKKILGHTGYQWIVKNKKRNSVVSYWVAEGNCNQYTFILNTINNTDKIINYFNKISNNKGWQILEAEEFSLVREKRMCLKALEIKKEKFNDKLFQLPDNFKLFE